MKRWIVVCTIVCSVGLAGVASVAHAGAFGIGVVAGEPTGVSLKSWLDGRHAVDAAVGWSFSENESLQLHADYLWHDFDLLRQLQAAGRLPVYYGIGGRFKLRHADDRHHRRNHDDDLLGVRFPVGVAWIAPAAPIDVFLEFVPVLDVLPGTDLGFNVAIGLRFWFP